MVIPGSTCYPSALDGDRVRSRTVDEVELAMLASGGTVLGLEPSGLGTRAASPPANSLASLDTWLLMSTSASENMSASLSSSLLLAVANFAYQNLSSLSVLSGNQ